MMDLRCTCGRVMTKGSMGFGAIGSFEHASCSCGTKALFFHIGKDKVLKYRVCKPEAEERKDADKLRDEFLSVFKLAGFEIEKHWDIKNTYTDEDADWLLVKTTVGLIRIGWRSHVMEIEWSDTGIMYEIKDNVTKGLDYCHADNYSKAVEYLTNMRRFGRYPGTDTGDPELGG